jgi:hypothetical protein
MILQGNFRFFPLAQAASVAQKSHCRISGQTEPQSVLITIKHRALLLVAMGETNNRSVY